MSFLTPDDYGLQIRQELRDLVTDGSSTLLDDAGLAAQVEMESYLRGRYDVVAIFTASNAVAAVPASGTTAAVPAQPDQRNRQVVMYLVDMAPLPPAQPAEPAHCAPDSPGPLRPRH